MFCVKHSAKSNLAHLGPGTTNPALGGRILKPGPRKAQATPAPYGWFRKLNDQNRALLFHIVFFFFHIAGAKICN